MSHSPPPPLPEVVTTDLDRIALVETCANLNQFQNLNPSQRIEAAERSTQKLVKAYLARADNFAGYQVNHFEKFAGHLAPLLNISMNNVGDPYADTGGYRLNSKVCERHVLNFFSTLFIGEPTEDHKVPQPSGLEAIPYGPDLVMNEKFFSAATGYVCNGSTEGNLWSLRQARDFLLGKISAGALDETSEGDFSSLVKNQRQNPTDPISFAFPSALLKNNQQEGSPLRHFVALHQGPSRVKVEPEDETCLKSFLPNTAVLSQNAFREPIILYSHATHYSMTKIKDMLEIETPRSFMKGFVQTAAGEVVKPSDCFAQLQKQPNLSDADRELTPEKYIEVFGSDTFPNCLPIHEDGTMNLVALKFMARLFFSLGNPIIVVANLGTTFTGAYEDPEAISRILLGTPGCQSEGHREEVIEGVEHTIIIRRNYYLHVDGALGACFVPYFEQHSKAATNQQLTEFLKNHSQDPLVQSYLLRLKTQGDILTEVRRGDSKFEKEPQQDSQQTEGSDVVVVSEEEAKEASMVKLDSIILPTFNLRKCPSVMSVAMSGHKFLGSPVPSGIAISLRRYQLDYLSGGDVSYIGSPDTTITGSRCALTTQVLHHYLSRYSREMTVLKYWVGYNSAIFTAKLAAHSIKSSVLFVPRDKFRNPANQEMTSFEQTLLEHQENEFKEPEKGRKAPLVFNFPGSLSVIFPEPSSHIQDKYCLSLAAINLDAKFYKFNEEYLNKSPIIAFNAKTKSFVLKCAHVYAMDSLSTKIIQSLCSDLEKDTRLRDIVAAQEFVKSE